MGLVNQKHVLYRYKFQFLLVSISLILFGDLLIPDRWANCESILILSPGLLFGVLIFEGKQAWRNLIVAAAGATFLCELVNLWSPIPYFRLLYILFYVLLSINLYRQIYAAKEIDPGMISAVFSGFLMLCLVGGIFFTVVEAYAPGSFSGIDPEVPLIEQLNYFSFISVLTIGYGDIAPLSSLARKSTLIIGLLGHFYTVFVMGIVIGKYLSGKRLSDPNSSDVTPN